MNLVRYHNKEDADVYHTSLNILNLENEIRKNQRLPRWLLHLQILLNIISKIKCILVSTHQ